MQRLVCPLDLDTSVLRLDTEGVSAGTVALSLEDVGYEVVS